MEANSIREFQFSDDSILPLTVVKDSSTYLQTSDSLEPQLVRTYEVRAFGYVHDSHLIDVETEESFTVTKINTKMGYTYLTIQERNMGF